MPCRGRNAVGTILRICFARAKVLVVGRAGMPQGSRTNAKLGYPSCPEMDPGARKRDVSCARIGVRLTPMGAKRMISNTGVPRHSGRPTVVPGVAMGLGHIHRPPCSTGSAPQRELGMWKTLVFLIVLITLLLAKGLRGVPKPSKAIVSARGAWRVENGEGPPGLSHGRSEEDRP
jgi:hypothetical protein